MALAGGVSVARVSDLWGVHAAMILSNGLLAASGPVVNKRTLSAGVNPFVFAFYKEIASIVVLAPVAYFGERRKRPPLELSTVYLLAILGVIGMFACPLLLLFGIKLASASLAGVVPVTVLIAVFLFSAAFGLEDLNWRRFDGQAKLGGLLCAVIGGLTVEGYEGPAILGSQFSQSGIESWQIGVMLLFLGGISIAVCITVQTLTLKKYPAPISMTVSANFFGLLSLGILGVITVQDRSDWMVFMDPFVVFSTIYVGVVAEGANIAIGAWVNHRAGPVLVATYAPLQPFFTSFMALVFLGEKVYLGNLLGGMLILCGLYLITMGKARNAKLVAESVNCLPPSKPISNLEEPLLASKV